MTIDNYSFNKDCESIFTIPKEIDGYPVTELGDDAFLGGYGIEGIIVPECIKKIGTSTFGTYNYNADLKWVRIENENLYIPDNSNVFGSYITIYGKENSTAYFYAMRNGNYFKDYEKIVQDGYLTGEIYDGEITITKCDAEAVDVIIPEEINGMPVTAIESMGFYDCRNLKSVYNPDSVTKISTSAFKNCTSLTSVRLPEGLTEIPSGCFSDCSSLEQIEIPQSVKKVNNSAFYECSALKSINIPESIEYIGANAFSGTPWIEAYTDDNNIVIVNGFLQSAENFEGENLVIPEGIKCINQNAFANNEKLKTVVIPEGVELIESYAFKECVNLSSVSLPSTLKEMKFDTFYGCTSLSGITLPESITEFGYGTFENCTSLTEIDIPDSVTAVNSRCFSGCTSLTNVSLPENLTLIGSSAFEDCTNLESIEIPDTVELIDKNAFKACGKIESIALPASLTSIENMAFYDCTSLSEISFPQDKYFEMYSTSFENTPWLEKQRSENELIIINTMLLDGTQCTGDVVVPNGITYICGYAFKNSEATSISLPASVQDFGFGAFSGCKNLTEFTIPDGIKVLSGCTFSGCSSLAKVNIPESVEWITNGVFDFCDGFTEFTVPKHVKGLGMVFSDCDNLKTVTIENPDCSVPCDNLSNFWTMPYNTTVRGYAGSKAHEFAYITERNFEEIYEIGDANADTEFDIADVTALQKWLLNDKNALKSWRAADMDNNEALNVFDFMIMKRNLLSQQ